MMDLDEVPDIDENGIHVNSGSSNIHEIELTNADTESGKRGL